MSLRSLLKRATALALAVAVAVPAAAQGVPVVRDAEIEALVADYARPILKAAGLQRSNIQIVLVNDSSFNAFVAGRRLFINTGALLQAETPNEIIGVIAHEAGHIAGGHQERLREQLARAQTMMIVASLLGIGAVAAGAATKNRTLAQAGTGIAAGGGEIARRGLLSYQRGEEATADRSAITYLEKTGQSAKGMLTTFERFANEALFKTSSIDPYVLSHPLPAERISALQDAAQKSPYYETKDSAALQARHDMMRAKLFGFMGDQAEIARRYPVSDNSLPARYARAISNYRFGRLGEALQAIDGLIASQPANAYFQELKGQVLMESGRAQAALPYLRKAASMVPAGTPIAVLLGHALVGAGGAANDKEAIRVLSRATQRDPDSSEGFQYLAMAYDNVGDRPNSQLASAQALFVAGKYVEARTQAKRAQDQFKEGSSGWLRADDILNYRPPKLD